MENPQDIEKKNIDEKKALETKVQELTAQLEALTKQNRNPDSKDNRVISFEADPTPPDEKAQIMKGAMINSEIKNMESILCEYKDHFPTSITEKIDFAFKQIASIPDEGKDLKVIRDDLAFLVCKVFFNYEGIEYPEHLTKKVEKVKNANKYSTAIKEEINDLLPHLPYITKSMQEMIDRKKNANLSFDGVGDGERGLEYYARGVSQCTVTAEELKKQLAMDPKRTEVFKAKCRRELDAFCKERGYKPPSGITRGLKNYSFGDA